MYHHMRTAWLHRLQHPPARQRLGQALTVVQRALVTPWVWLFAAGASVTFMSLLGACFALYGAPFLHEAFLYHVSRCEHDLLSHHARVESP